MKITDIAFTGYCVMDTTRAKTFYEGVLGLTASRTFGDGKTFEWIEYDIGSATLALIKGDGVNWKPSEHGTSVALEVDDFAGFVAKIKAAGAKIIFDVQETPVCHILVVADPDGNRIAIHQRKATAV